jgi:hypothetical protein
MVSRPRPNQNAIERFWKPILVSALSEDLDLISISYAAQVVRESMKSPAARHMGVPSIPLTDLYNKAGDYIRARGGEIRLRTSLKLFRRTRHMSRFVSPIKTRKDQEASFDYLILALPFNTVDRRPSRNSRRRPAARRPDPLRILSHHRHPSLVRSPDTDLDHAVLLDRTIQWMFHKSRLLITRKCRSGRAAVFDAPLKRGL